MTDPVPSISCESIEPEIIADVLVIGAGAAGLTAALVAAAAGAEVVVLERDASPSGSTSMSSGFVPAPATRYQREIGVVDDSVEAFIDDIMAKSKYLSDERLAHLAAHHIGPAIEWLGVHAGVAWHVLDGFLYPGHSRHRMHAVPEKTGAALQARLLSVADAAGIALVTGARADVIVVDEGGAARAVTASRPDGTRETVGCEALILACNGYGGQAEMIAKYAPEIATGTYYGHAGNTGHAVAWGEALGAELRHLSGYQGHGSLAHPHGILISWALMTQGAVQVNSEGRRFSDETGGYSEQAVKVLAQPGGVAWNIYDAARHAFAMDGFPDYRDAEAAGALHQGESWAELAQATGLPVDELSKTMEDVAVRIDAGGTDSFGRTFRGVAPLAPPYFAVKVTGALFHTQGGLMIGQDARVVTRDGAPLPNIYAAGGAACGVSGPNVEGYLSGNGLLTALAFGYVAGAAAAVLAAQA